MSALWLQHFARDAKVAVGHLPTLEQPEATTAASSSDMVYELLPLGVFIHILSPPSLALAFWTELSAGRRRIGLRWSCGTIVKAGLGVAVSTAVHGIL